MDVRQVCIMSTGGLCVDFEIIGMSGKENALPGLERVLGKKG